MNIAVAAKLVVLFSSTLLIASCGNGGDIKAAGQTDSTSSAATTTTPAAAPAGSIPGEKGLELIGASDCTTCHRLNQASAGPAIGPPYNQVAAKYSPAADTTVDRLVKKIISGGSGVWGTIPMTPHPSLPEGDIREMVKYILTLKK
jgi:cytochrome c